MNAPHCVVVPPDQGVARPWTTCLHFACVNPGHVETCQVRASEPYVMRPAVRPRYIVGFQIAVSLRLLAPAPSCGLQEDDICEQSMVSLVYTELND